MDAGGYGIRLIEQPVNAQKGRSETAPRGKNSPPDEHSRIKCDTAREAFFFPAGRTGLCFFAPKFISEPVGIVSFAGGFCEIRGRNQV